MIIKACLSFLFLIICIILSACNKTEDNSVDLKTFLEDGQVVEEMRVSDMKPIEEVEILANEGDVLAQAELGSRFLEGYQAPVDAKKAFDWNLKAAKQGHAMAQYYVAQAFEFATDKSEDERRTKALEWYKKSADGCEVEAQNWLSLLYREGKGYDDSGIKMELDIKLGIQYLEKAARNKHGGAMAELGLVYANGNGVDVDLIEGLAWGFVGDEYFPNGDAYTSEFELVKKKMTEEQIKSAKNRATVIVGEINNNQCQSRIKY